MCSARLGSGIVSTGLQCGDSFCDTSGIKLTNPVLITIQHSNAVMVCSSTKMVHSHSGTNRLNKAWKWSVYFGTSKQTSKTLYESCNVGWNIDCWLYSAEDSSLITSGQWSQNGCHKNDTLSNISRTVCECDHLTHFAILLSPVPLNYSKGVEISLQAVGYVGVAVSLLAMAVTVVTFIFLR